MTQIWHGTNDEKKLNIRTQNKLFYLETLEATHGPYQTPENYFRRVPSRTLKPPVTLLSSMT